MPRNTCRPSECAASQDEPEASANNNNNNNNNNNEGIIKQELEAAPPVCHRKSERRRVARDIFLVFEEQTTRRRGKGARGKATRAKQKFGHLKVANTPRINKNVLREIKTEPKCSPEAVTPVAAAPATITPIPALNHLIPPPLIAPPNLVLPEEQQPPPAAKPLPRTAAVKLETKTTVTPTAIASNVAASKRISPKPKAPPRVPVEEEEEEKAVSPATPAPLQNPQPVSAPATSPTTPSVNPIFLWVKQDDTRIVEVRCEDYDKRNRIRLTKTTNGWRSMPRTDASSTRIVKFFHGSAAPLMKVKREQHLQRLEEEEEHQHQQQELEQAEEREQEEAEQQLPNLGQSLLHDWDDSATQLPDEIEEEEEEEDEEQEMDPALQQNGHLTTVASSSLVEVVSESVLVSIW